jgi:hypothetical protein
MNAPAPSTSLPSHPDTRPKATGGYRSWLGRRPATVALAFALIFGIGCSWDPIRLPEKPRARDPVDAPTDPRLGVRLSDTLECTTAVCVRRFRIVVPEPGKLTIGARANIENANELFSISLESTHSGVLGSKSTDTDPGPLLLVSADATPGTYFLLIRGAGGRIPYTVGSRLERGGAPVKAATSNPDIEIAKPDLRKLEGGAAGGGAAYDPGVDFGAFKTFAFVKRPKPQPGQAGQPMEEPVERQLRRTIAFDLERKGFVRGEPDTADFLIGVGIGSSTAAWYSRGLPYYFDTWESGGHIVGTHTYSQRTLVIDMVDPKAEKLVWHGWSSVGVPPLRMRDEVINEIVAEVLDAFPPPY